MTKDDSQSKHIAIVGAGVIGLTIAQEARKRNYTVSIFARDFPPGALDSSNDAHPATATPESQDWSSPWAGFNWCSFATMDDTMTQRRDEVTFKKWMQMVRERVLPREHMELVPFEDVRTEDQVHQCWFRDLVPEFKVIQATQSSPPKLSYRSITVSTPHYLSYLVRTLRDRGPSSDAGLGPPVKFHRIETLPSLASLFDHPALSSSSESLLVVNATGLGSLHLSDVRDTSMYPIRGQTVLIRSPRSFTENPRCVMSTLTPKPTYVIPRAASGYVVLGGTFDEGDWSRDAQEEDTERICRDCVRLCPQLVDSDGDADRSEAWRKLDIVAVNVGTRPARKGETRVELDAVRTADQGLRPVLHAYGAGKAGFQGSIGIAQEALNLIDMHFNSIQ